MSGLIKVMVSCINVSGHVASYDICMKLLSFMQKQSHKITKKSDAINCVYVYIYLRDHGCKKTFERKENI